MKKGSIKIVGLGPGNAGHLSTESIELLKNADKVILRTNIHPTVVELMNKKIMFESCDKFYEESSSFEEVYQNIAEYVLKEAKGKNLVYAVPGSPLVAEQTVVLLREMVKNTDLDFEIYPAISFLDITYVKAGIDPIEGLRIVDAGDEEALLDAGKYPLIITQVYSELVASDTKIALMEVLKDDTPIYFMRNLGLEDEEFLKIKLYELDRQKHIDHLTTVLVPKCPEYILEEYLEMPTDEELEEVINSFGDKDGDSYEDSEEDLYTEDNEEAYYDVTSLAEVVALLRKPDGCPWDKEQTHESIRANMIEEAYEVVDAIDKKDNENLKEELGDVLLQVVFHAQMAREEGQFNLQDVIDAITDKLIRRHPHVFGDEDIETSDEVLKRWDDIKKTEKTERVSVLDGVPKALPSLSKAYELQKKAGKVGFDWPDIMGVRAKIDEELAEVDEALAKLSEKSVDEYAKNDVECEIGDVLFSIANFAKHLGIEPEVALNRTNAKFLRRFEYVENQVKKSNKMWSDFSLEALDIFWEEAKKQEK
jgi:tetrapyrrole methylase family protein/MazG family protein